MILIYTAAQVPNINLDILLRKRRSKSLFETHVGSLMAADYLIWCPFPEWILFLKVWYGKVIGVWGGGGGGGGTLQKTHRANHSLSFPLILLRSECQKIHWWEISIRSVNDSVPPGNKPLPDFLLTQIYDAIWGEAAIISNISDICSCNGLILLNESLWRVTCLLRFMVIEAYTGIMHKAIIRVLLAFKVVSFYGTLDNPEVIGQVCSDYRRGNVHQYTPDDYLYHDYNVPKFILCNIIISIHMVIMFFFVK